MAGMSDMPMPMSRGVQRTFSLAPERSKKNGHMRKDAPISYHNRHRTTAFTPRSGGQERIKIAKTNITRVRESGKGGRSMHAYSMLCMCRMGVLNRGEG